MILGAIIGDVVGCPYEFNNIKTKKFKLVTKHSSFTDDTVMTLAVSAALCKWKKGEVIDENEFSQALIGSMREFGRRYPYAGYGGRFFQWLSSDDPQPYNSWGNESAMRVSPVAWYFDDIETVERFAALTAKITHNHPEGIKGAQATAAAIFLARKGKSKSSIKGYIEARYDYDLSRTCDEIRPDYSFDGSCQGFEDALRNAVSLGGDSEQAREKPQML